MKKHLFAIALLLIPLISFAAAHPHLLPAPQSYKATNGEYIIGNNLPDFQSAPNWVDVHYVDSLEGVSVNQNEAYRLKITSQKVTVHTITGHGLYNALQTLRQLTYQKDNIWYLQACEILDWPAFRIRGFMHDTGRSYISLEELKREIALLSTYKINVFHWHLTENQAWRLESKRFPVLNDSSTMSRMPGLYYTHEDVRELMEHCRRHHVLLIPEFDMPGHSESFVKAFGYDMQSDQGLDTVKQLLEEACELFADLPYFHIGTDEVRFTNPRFVPEVVELLRNKGKKVISWNPGWNYKDGEIDMLQMWSYRGKPHPGIPVIDSRLHYINHYDSFADVAALYYSNIAGQQQGSHDYAGTILAVWNDRFVQPERNIILENAFYPAMLTLAERAWCGGGKEYMYTRGTLIGLPGTKDYADFAAFENRMLYHKERYFKGYPFAYVRQCNVQWRISDPFPNDGDLTKTFPPETEDLSNGTFTYEGKTYNSREAIGAGIYLRHVWGNIVPSFYKDPQPNHTAYAWTWVYSPVDQEVGLWASTQNYGRSEKDLPPPQGKWDYKESRIWVNDSEITPPVWTATHTTPDNEIPLGNENFEARPPIPVTLVKGWNKVLLKLPVGAFTAPQVRLVKWMFTFVFVTPDGEKAVEGLIYSPEKQNIPLQLSGIFTDHMVIQRNSPFQVNGMANPGETIRVKIGNQEKATIAGANGEWQVTMEPLVTGPVYTLEVNTPQQTRIIKDIQAGEVWVCSGQSNMEFQVNQTDEKERKQLIRQAAKYPSIRFFDSKARWRTNATSWAQSALDSINRLDYFCETSWTTCNPQTASQVSAVAYSFACMLSDSLQVPVGLIINAVGGSPTEAWIDRPTLEDGFPDILPNFFENPVIQPWVRERTRKNIALSTNINQRHPYQPTYLFESAIKSLRNFPVRGVIWYQGESNAHDVEAHEKLFPLLIKSWRKNWKKELPFYYVQLSSLNRPTWPQFRNSQRQLMDKIPGTGMVVSTDRGDSLDVHPRQKAAIGQRLARWALHKTYGRSLTPSGPLLKNLFFIRDTAYVEFNYGNDLKTSDGKEIRTFELAGKDSIFHPAHALPAGNGLIKAWSEAIPAPYYIRYGWQPFTRANLVNGDDLPASTFAGRLKAQRSCSRFHYQRATLFDLLPIKPQDIVFLGNSITNGGEWHELFNDPRIKNRGISGDTSGGVYDRLDPIVRGTPRKIFLLIGINDIALNVPIRTIRENIERIILRVKEETPETALYLQSVLPVNPDFGVFSGHQKPDSIQYLNTQIEELSRQYGVTYIDLYSNFVQEGTRKMSPEFTNDGLHLLGEGYLHWAKIIKPYLKDEDKTYTAMNKLPDYPIQGGVSAPFAAMINNNLIVAGGCNFPDKPVTQGGTKRYYSEIYRLADGQDANWQLIGRLPDAVAYGAAVSTPKGMVCIGGNNNETSFAKAYLINWTESEGLTMNTLPELPCTIDNTAAAALGNTIYVAGGNENGKPSTSLFSLNLDNPQAGWQRLPSFPGSARVQPVLVAQKGKQGMGLYLAGGFSIADNQPPSVPQEALVYLPEANEWKVETTLPPLKDSSRRTLTGGCGLQYGDNGILLFGGVNYQRFYDAVDRPRQMAEAKASNDTSKLDSLQQEAAAYMHHPIEWYKFNNDLISYNTMDSGWQVIAESDKLARAGAGAVIRNNRIIIINGELKPGIRTPEVYMSEEIIKE